MFECNGLCTAQFGRSSARGRETKSPSYFQITEKFVDGSSWSSEFTIVANGQVVVSPMGFSHQNFLPRWNLWRIVWLIGYGFPEWQVPEDDFKQSKASQARLLVGQNPTVLHYSFTSIIRPKRDCRC